VYTSRGETCRTEVYPEKGYVIKRFVPRKPKFGRPIDALRGSLDLCFYRELECLTRLEDHNHFPKVIDCDQKELWIKMTYVGENFEKYVMEDKEIYINQVDEIVDTLESKNIKLAYEWSPGDGRIGYCLSMMLFKNNVLSLIDFERAWPEGCTREGEFSSLFVDSFSRHDNNKFREVLKKTISTLYEKK
jgi:hypothetical protein